jgi:hypothetical protein
VSRFPLSGIPLLLFVAGFFHFIQVIATYVFMGPIAGRGEGQGNTAPSDCVSAVTRRGLVTFVLGSGVLVMLNARAIFQGGGLAISLCALLALVFSYRFYAQIFFFSRFLRLGAHRVAHWVLVFCAGFSSVVYSYSIVVLFVR